MSEQQQLQIRIDKELHTEFKSLAARKNISMGNVIETFIKEWVEENREDK